MSRPSPISLINLEVEPETMLLHGGMNDHTEHSQPDLPLQALDLSLALTESFKLADIKKLDLHLQSKAFSSRSGKLLKPFYFVSQSFYAIDQVKQQKDEQGISQSFVSELLTFFSIRCHNF